MGSTDWDVLPHEQIEKLSENVWRVEGTLPQFGLKRVMTVAKRKDGSLVIHSAIALRDECMREIEAWGRPEIMLIPHVRHRMDAPRFKARYPALRVLVTPGAKRKADEVVLLAGLYEDFPNDEDVEVGMLRGTGSNEGFVKIRSADGVTLVLNEVVFDLSEPDSFAKKILMRVMRLGPGPRVTPIVKLELLDDRRALRRHLEELAQTPGLTRLIVSHDRLSRGQNAREGLLRAAETL